MSRDHSIIRIQQLLQNAIEGNQEAQELLAIALQYGPGVEIDSESTLSLAQQAIEQCLMISQPTDSCVVDYVESKLHEER